MKSQEQISQNPSNLSNNRLQEIGQILANAICRLHSKETQISSTNQLDFKTYPSVHASN